MFYGGSISMASSEQEEKSEHDKTAALHEIAEDVEKERESRGHSLLDGEDVVSNEDDGSEGHKDATLADDVASTPPAMPSGN
jgi:hypothetical protein